jgi:hypothetical protein
VILRLRMGISLDLTDSVFLFLFLCIAFAHGYKGILEVPNYPHTSVCVDPWTPYSPR